jgi:hypothetical protein
MSEFTVSQRDWELLVQRVAELERVAHSREVELARGQEVAIPEKSKSKRGSRLSEDFVPREETIGKMREELGVSAQALVSEHRKFCDYWLSVAGSRGVKLDWDRTWCNWMRTAAERGQLGVSAAAPARRTNDDKVQGWLEVGAEGA